MALGLPVVLGRAYPAFAAAPTASGPYTPPKSPRSTLNFNYDWKFIREDISGAEVPAFDDSKWTTVATPHSFNDVDSFRKLISHGGGDMGTYKGLSWYRKHFTLPAALAGNRVFLEFEGMRQAGDIFLNGKQVGLYENGVTAYGIDITDAVHLGTQGNVLAVKVDNTTTYKERAFCMANPKNADGTPCVGTSYQWSGNNFNPNHGGINRRVWLHVTGKIHQTLPLYYGLESQGVYIHAGNFNIAKKTADVTVDAEVHNTSGDRATIGLSAVVVDHNGHVRAQFEGDPVDMVDGEKSVMSATGPLANARFWSVEDPYLYDVYSILKVDGKVVDVNRIETGFRKAEFKGGAGTGGLYINEKFVYLKGFSQRAADEWAGVGAGYPDWMHDHTARMIRECHGNYMRWMHISPQKVDADSFARFGIVQVCPAGDSERDVTGRQWDQRVEVMRNSIIYFRNNPSIFFWEAGNTMVAPNQMQQMVDLRKQWDPDGGRAMGARGDANAAINTATTPIAEYYGVMMAQDRGVETLNGPKAMFRAYSAERRDRAPIIESEDYRQEGSRRMWDDFSPPYYKAKKGPNDSWMQGSEYLYTSESFALDGIKQYWAYWSNRISNTDPAHSRWSAYCSIYFTDEDADGRQDSSEVARVSGKVDSMRLPKEIYFAHRVIQSEQPDLHILGHWTYPLTQPDGSNTKKTIYVISNTQSVELFVNGKSAGVNSKPDSGWIFAFPDIAFAPGSIKAIGKNGDKVAAQQELVTAGAPAALKLTPILGPHGLQADGEDIALIDFEVVDAKGLRCPTDDARVDFTCTGPAIWRGGYNSGKLESTNNTYLNTECGINRVAVRSRLVRTTDPAPGPITVTASREGLKSALIHITSKPVVVTDGVAPFWPQQLQGPAEK
ncbi:MAG: sugar-binding domain-containing protein [Acidobacteriaceae bacterium]|jgi:beta-galactosidase